MISDLSFFLDVELFGSVKPPLFPALRTLISERMFLHFAKKKNPPPPKNYHKLELNEPIVCFQNITPSKLPLSPHPKKNSEFRISSFIFFTSVGCELYCRNPNTTIGQNFDDWLIFIVPNEHYYLQSSRRSQEPL